MPRPVRCWHETSVSLNRQSLPHSIQFRRQSQSFELGSCCSEKVFVGNIFQNRALALDQIFIFRCNHHPLAESTSDKRWFIDQHFNHISIKLTSPKYGRGWNI